MNHHLTRTTLLLAVALISLSPTVWACSCIDMGEPPCQAYWSTEGVFLGRVTADTVVELKEPDGLERQRKVRLTITQSFKGVSGNEVELITGLGGGDCGFYFQMGESYLVYARRHRERWVTGICDRTRPLAQAADDLAYLRALPDKEPGATVTGRVEKQVPASAGQRPQTTRQAGITIRLEGQGIRRETKTDEVGRYHFTGLRRGHYKVRADLPAYTRANAEQEIEIHERSCAEANFYVQAVNRK